MKIWIAFLLAFLFGIEHLYSKNIVVDPSTTYIDARAPMYSKIAAGDTIFLKGGNWTDLQISNVMGSPKAPIVIINKGGIVTFSTDHNHALSFSNCRYFHLTGTGYAPEFYGIQVAHVENGTGLGIGDLSSDYEIDHLLIRNVPIAGIFAKTDPNCQGNNTRDKFIQYHTIIHDTYIENAGNEGMYIGSTRYSGQNINCNGRDTLLMPSLLKGVKIYNNIIKNSGWDGIQVSSASTDCQVYGNQIYHDSQAEVPGQMSGIILGGGSKCDCFNNLIADGKGIGIENHGLAGNRIFNNIIVNAGRTYFPTDQSASKMKHGIFVSDISALPDSSIIIQNNTIINPKSDGIRFSSIVTKSNLISSNLIINPGNYYTYKSDNTRFREIDSYVMIPNNLTDVIVRNNFFSLNIDKAKLNEDYSLKAISPLINKGYSIQPYISFDFANHPRSTDNIPDIGAYEYLLPDVGNRTDSLQDKSNIYYMNPVINILPIGVVLYEISDVTIQLYDTSGKKLIRKEWLNCPEGFKKIDIGVEGLIPGLYIFTLKTSKNTYSRKFIKVDGQ